MHRTSLCHQVEDRCVGLELLLLAASSYSRWRRSLTSCSIRLSVALVSVEIEMSPVSQVVVVTLTDTITQRQHVQVMVAHARLVPRNIDSWCIYRTTRIKPSRRCRTPQIHTFSRTSAKVTAVPSFIGKAHPTSLNRPQLPLHHDDQDGEVTATPRIFK
jgi:hypothetical protein